MKGCIREFGEVVVPRTVYEEVTRNKDFPSEKKMIEESPFITAADVKDMDAVQALMTREKIHRGEAEAILLVEEQFGKEETSLLVDDGDARLVATREGVHIIGTIGALGKAFREGRVTKEEMAQYADIMPSAVFGTWKGWISSGWWGSWLLDMVVWQGSFPDVVFFRQNCG